MAIAPPSRTSERYRREKRRKAVPEEVVLPACKECGAYAVVRGDCLKCGAKNG